MAGSHKKLHPLGSSDDHDLTGFTAEKLLKVNAAGDAVEEATNTDAEVDSAVQHVSATGNPHGIVAADIADVYSMSEVDTLVDATLKAPEAFTPAGSYPVTYDGGTVQKGDSYRILASGVMGGVVVNVEDLLVAVVDDPGQVDANWMVAESNRDQATETVKGVVEIATQAEADAGLDDSRAVTPLKGAASYLRKVAGYFSTFTAKALPAIADIVVLEDSSDAGAKKSATVGSIASVGSLAYEASATDTVTTTSLTTVPRPTTPVTLTPPAGKYLVVASAYVSNNSNTGGCRLVIRAAGAEVAHSERRTINTGAQFNGRRNTLSSSAIVTVNGSQAIEVYVSSLVGGTASFYNTSLDIVKVQ